MKDKRTKKPSPLRPTHRLPWWIFVMLAVGSYCTLKYVFPDLHPVNPAFGKFTQMAPTLAPPISILFLLLAAKRLYDTDRGKEDADQPGDAEE